MFTLADAFVLYSFLEGRSFLQVVIAINGRDNVTMVFNMSDRFHLHMFDQLFNSFSADRISST